MKSAQKLSKPDGLIKGRRCSAWLLLIDGMPDLRSVEGPKMSRMETSFYTGWGNFVIRKGSAVEGLPSLLRSSSNAFLIKLQGNPHVEGYEIRMTLSTKATNYEKGVN